MTAVVVRDRPETARPARRGAAADDWPRTTRLLPWLIAGFVAMIWLLPVPQTQLPFSLPVDALPDRVAILLIGVLWLLCAAAGGRHAPRLRSNAVHGAIIVYGVVAIASVLLNANELNSVGELTLGIKRLSLLGSLLALYFIVATVIRPSEIRAFSVFLVILACITAAGTAYEYRSHVNLFYDLPQSVLPGWVTHPAQFGQLDEAGRRTIVGPTQHGLAVASILAMVLPFAIIGFIDARGRARRVLWLLATAIIVGGAVATLRKTSLVAPAGGVVILLLYRPRAAIRLLPLALVAAGVIHLISPGALGAVQDQLLTAGQVSSTKGRTNDYAAVVPEVMRHPVLGRGFQTFLPPVHRFLDNEYLGTTIDTGFVGIAAYVGLMLTVALIAHRGIRQGDPVRGPPMLGIICAIATFAIVNALFDALGFIEVPYMFFLLAAFAVVCSDRPSPARVASPTVALGRRGLVTADAHRGV